MEESVWPVVMQVAAFAVLLLALGEVGLGLLSRVRRFSYEQDVYDQALESFEEKLMTARVRRIDRGREMATWNGLRKFEVVRKVDEGGDICSFYLEPHDKKPIPSFRPGQYLTFSLKIPDQSRPLVRCYSLSDAPDPTCYRVSIKRCLPPRSQPDAPPGRSSFFFHDHIHQGDIVDVKSPGGDFYLDLAEVKPAVLIGGGIGLTPVLSMLNAIVNRGFDRDVWFFYGVRDGSEHVLKDHLDGLAKQHPERLRLHVGYSDVAEKDLPEEPPAQYHPERISVDLFKRVLPSSNFDYYICGPPPMMDSLTHDLREWGVPDKQVHFESFGPASVKKTPKAEAAAAGAGSTIKVTFEKSGKELQWDPSVGSLLDFAESNDVMMDSGCRAGGCGTCITAVKSGDVEYLSAADAAPDAGSCLTCISVPKSDLVLDA